MLSPEILTENIEPALQEDISEAPLLSHNPDARGLEKLLENDTLVVVRQIEMMNIFMGFEVANRYAINDVNGNVVGYMAEEPKGFMGTFARQLFKTHRAFRSVIMDANGTPILWIHRPFSFINSRLFVQRKLAESDGTGEHTSLVNLGEAKQEWHPWRRKYHLFLGQPQGHFSQFAFVDSPLFAWDFFLQNEKNMNVASIRKGWTGLGREMFTDTSQYTIRLSPDPVLAEVQDGAVDPAAEVASGGTGRAAALSEAAKHQTIVEPRHAPLSLEERALVLALSVGIDFDYFSRHSEGPGMGLPLLAIFSVFE
ncbi:hypothetical protein FRB96_000070 [Tulasnella sp. 330]|nr:hypothetical protein FRB96_000070 [Tulasnella sp. 330]KAG8884075.1 hypothetical protein FRB97_005297 [Tulasnella sp. 331]